ncbi:phospholipase D-like domain-containing protein [Bacteroidota bacterium]
MKKIIVILVVSLFCLNSFSQSTIAEVRAMEVGAVVTVTGIVINGDELGVIRYIQDETGGIGIYPGTGSVAFTPNRGDEVTVTGTIAEYASLLEIDLLTSVTVNSTDNTLPEPVVLTPSQIEESYEGMLVRIEEALFENPGGTFAGNSNYTLLSNGQSFLIRINPNSNIVGEVIPAAANVVAIVSQYSWGSPTEGYQLLPRDMNDLEVLSILSITSLPEQSNITTTGFTLSWTTNDTSLTRLDYGLTEDLELGTIGHDDYVAEHSVDLTGLEAGTVYFAKAYSILADDTASTAIKVFTTVSNSSGEMKVYFTQSIDPSVSSGETAVSAINTIEDTIISYIDMAQQTLDIIIYDVESEPIVEAINNAYDRGVAIRYITDSVPDVETNPVLENLNPGIPVLKGNTAAIMHDKFIIIDREDEQNCWVMTGSTNHTHANLGWDFNNMICIQDMSLASAFLMEFNEMWGADGMTPDPGNALFGSAKKDNTPHNFIIGGSPVELYFSPSDHTTTAIINALETSEYDLEFAMMVFTENGLGSAVNDAFDAGVNVRGIIDYVEYTGDEFDYLLGNGIDVLDYQNPDGTSWPDGPVFHHKYAIVDFNSPDSDPIVVTGSHNWSASAESSNDENTLIIHDSIVANLFHQEFSQRFIDQLTPVPFDDMDSTIIGQDVLIDVLSNDFVHFQIENTAIELTEQPNHGVASIVNDSIYYEPETEFSGYDTLTYQLCNADFEGYCNTAICVIKVQLVEIFALDDNVSISMDTSSTLFPLTNDYGTADDEFLLTIIEQGQHGIAQVLNDTSFMYIPEDGYYGGDTLKYQICYLSLPELCDEANMNIVIEPILPVANMDTITTDMNHAVSANVLFNDENDAEFNLVVSIEEEASHGASSVSDSMLTYTPETDYWGLDTVHYRISKADDAEVYDIGYLVINVVYVESVNENENIKGVKIFPNPNNGFFDIELMLKSSEEINVEITNVSGKLVYKTKKSVQTGKNVIPVNLNNHTGIYLLKIFTSESVNKQKIILK